MDRAFLATAYGYPLGASFHWMYVDASGAIGTRFDWTIGSQVLQSPDGQHLVYVGPDTRPPSRQLVVRDTAAGPARVLAAGDRNAFRWADAYHVLLDPVMEHGAIHALDIRDGSDVVLFRPPAAPVANPTGPDWDSWELSGDLRWAVLTQTRVDPATGEETVIGHWLYDRTTAKYVGTLDQPYLSLAPAGDLAVWIDGPSVRAMHLCDRRVATLGSIPTVEWQGGIWSTDGRYFSMYSGMTDEDHGPSWLMVLDTALGQVAQIAQPWGFIQKWSPDNQYVVLGRRGYHDIVARLATLTLAPSARPNASPPDRACAAAEQRVLGGTSVIVRADRVETKRTTAHALFAVAPQFTVPPVAPNESLCVVAVAGDIRQSTLIAVRPRNWAVYVSRESPDEPLGSQLSSDGAWPEYFPGLPTH